MKSEKLIKVLCINDNEISLFIQKRTLTKAMFSEEIITASNGREAFEYCDQLIKNFQEAEDSYPRLILLDLHMPEMDGWEFLDHFANKFWQFFTDTKVIITSYSIDKRDYERVKEYPFVIDFLSSPISTEYLRNIQGSLAQSSMLQN